MKKIHESLFILFKCHKTIDRVYEAMQANQQPKGVYAVNHFTHNLAYYIIMETVSFLDEYNGAFVSNVEPEYKQRVIDVRRVAAPIVKKINEWADLKRFRHHIIAHPWRDEGNGNKFVIPHQRYYDVPRNGFEFQLLKDLVRYVYETVRAEFPVEADEAIYYAYNLVPDPKPKKDYSNINTELLNMIQEADKIAQKLGKDYDVKINAYIFPEDEDQSDSKPAAKK